MNTPVSVSSLIEHGRSDYLAPPLTNKAGNQLFQLNVTRLVDLRFFPGPDHSADAPRADRHLFEACLERRHGSVRITSMSCRIERGK